MTPPFFWIWRRVSKNADLLRTKLDFCFCLSFVPSMTILLNPRHSPRAYADNLDFPSLT
jgi:hypothetical protein